MSILMYWISWLIISYAVSKVNFNLNVYVLYIYLADEANKISQLIQCIRVDCHFLLLYSIDFVLKCHNVIGPELDILQHDRIGGYYNVFPKLGT